MKAETLRFALPSLVQRIGREQAKQAKHIATTMHCQLKRIRRSRHWQLMGREADIVATIKQLQASDNPAFDYLIAKLNEQLKTHQAVKEPLPAKLQRLLNERPNITLTELMEQSDCSLTQARLARFEHEFN